MTPPKLTERASTSQDSSSGTVDPALGSFLPYSWELQGLEMFALGFRSGFV